MLYVVAVIAAVAWRSRVHDLGRSALAFLIPMGLSTGGLLVVLLGGQTRSGALLLAGLTVLGLTLFRSTLNQAMSRESIERIALRKRLASARAFFRDQLDKPQPTLRDDAKAAARDAVHYALKVGVIARAPCEVCGERRTEAHHDDYERPLDVRWLCPQHHREHHQRERAS